MRRAALVGVVLLMTICPSAQQGRGPSTREERDRAVRITHELEADPLSPSLRDDRDWLLKWLQDVPDITINVCVDPADRERQYRYGRELFLQKMFGSATFVIENPAQKHDDISVETAGVEEALKAYQSILKKYPKAHSYYWDRLLKKQADGTLRDYVSSYLEAACGSEQVQT